MDWFENSTALCKSVGEVSVMLRMSGAQFDMNHCLLLKTSRIVIDNYVKCLRKNDEEKILPYNLIEIDTRVRERFLVLIL